jgi:hypothetical protein
MTRFGCRSGIATLIIIAVWLMVSVVLSAGEASAQGKRISGIGKFGPVMSQTTLLPGDAPKHEVMLINRTQTWTSTDPAWNNVDVTQFVFSDYVAGTGYHRGHNVNVHPGGDRTFVSYEGRTTRTTNSDGSWESKFEGTMRFTGGTGTFQGVKGEGTYVGKASAPSGPTPTSASFEWQAEYSLPK